MSKTPIYMIETCCTRFESESKNDFFIVSYNPKRNFFCLTEKDRIREVTYCPFCGQKFQMHSDSPTKVKKESKKLPLVLREETVSIIYQGEESKMDCMVLDNGTSVFTMESLEKICQREFK